MTQSLSDFYRSREIYVKLPTNGVYYKNLKNLSVDGELGVMPMTNRDEVMLKVPDTLYNGAAIFELIKSIAPDIEDPYELKIPDLDVIILATRVASYGEQLEVSATCPHCAKTNEYSVDLTGILAGIKSIPQDDELEINNLTVKLQPNSVKSITARGMSLSKTNAAIMQMRNQNDQELLKTDQFKELLESISAAEIVTVADAIQYVRTPDGTEISDMQEIVNWITNSTSYVYKQLRKAVNSMNDSGVKKTFTYTCGNEDCEKTFENDIELNPTFFFSDSIPRHSQTTK